MKNLKLLTYTLAVFCIIISYKDSFADTSFSNPISINHPDKRVSNASAIIADDGRIYIGWTREDGDKNNIYIVTSADDGKTFSDKVRVNGDGDMPSGISHSPSMASGAKGELYIAWVTEVSGNSSASTIKFSRSLDGGKTFEPSVTVNDDKAPASHGFESIAVASDGSIYIAWLDGREKHVPADSPIEDFGDKIKQGKEGSSATYFARSLDGGKSFEKNVRVDGNSCPCCKTAVTVSHDGTVYVSWRKVFKGDVREIVMSKSTDKGKSFSESVVVGNDKWVIAGCPHRGPSISTDKDGILYVVWYTEGETGTPSIYIANSKDGGMNFSKKLIPFSNGTFPDHPVMALNKDGKLVLAWEETTPVVGRLMLQLPDEKPQQIGQGVRMRRARDPVISVNKKGDMLLAWSHDEMRSAKTLLRLFKGD